MLTWGKEEKGLCNGGITGQPHASACIWNMTMSTNQAAAFKVLQKMLIPSVLKHARQGEKNVISIMVFNLTRVTPR